MVTLPYGIGSILRDKIDTERIKRGLLELDELRKLVYGGNVVTLLQDGLEKVEQGFTTFEEVLKLIELDDEQAIGEKYDLDSAINGCVKM
jgi:hypothetical protein